MPRSNFLRHLLFLTSLLVAWAGLAGAASMHKGWFFGFGGFGTICLAAFWILEFKAGHFRYTADTVTILAGIFALLHLAYFQWEPWAAARPFWLLSFLGCLGLTVAGYLQYLHGLKNEGARSLS